MIQLAKHNIKLNAAASTKAQAIDIVGQLLVANGHMQQGYVDSMMQRERLANTYLGNGIAIPHGLPKDRALILNTGIAVAQFPHGVAWNAGETVYLLVGIAAKSDEHIEVLTNLTHVLDDVQAVQQMSSTTNEMDIIQRLMQLPNSVSSTTEVQEEDFSCFEDVVLQDKAGMHARPATAFVDIAKQFQSEIRVRCGSKIANGKSMMALLKLGAEYQSILRIMAQGKDQELAVKALSQAVRDGLEPEQEDAADAPSQHEQLQLTTTASITGIGASAGIAIAPLYHFRHKELQFAEFSHQPANEIHHLQKAIATGLEQLQSLYEEVKARSGAARAAIFAAQQQFLSDSELLAATIHRIEAGHSAGWAWRKSIEEKSQEIAQLDNALLKERAADMKDVGHRVLRLLAGGAEQAFEQPVCPVILLAEDLSPSDTVKLDASKVLGICTAAGGPTSHTAIIARSLGIPAIVSAGEAVLSQVEGQMCILDGNSGHLYVNPQPADIAIAEKVHLTWQASRQAEAQSCYQPAITQDGFRIEVVANAGSAPDAALAVNAGAEGIGLLRTEFLFLQRSSPPTEDEQFAAYKKMTYALNGLPLIIRTLDIGGDKEVPYLSVAAEQNPFLGMRGIRLCLEHPDLFRPQLRAIYRAAKTGPVRIMFPMIATLEELLLAKAMAEEVRLELNAPMVDIGIMIEVPSAVMMAAELAQHVDFFSIGTNDLTQYVLAMDRMHPSLARQADALHPAVLRMIELTIKAAKAAGIWVGVCGGMAADAKGAAILVGMGAAELSVSIPSVATIKAQLRKMNMVESQQLAQLALKCKTSAEVRAL